MATNKDIWHAYDILTEYLIDNIPSNTPYWEDWYPEIDKARLLILEHLDFKQV